MLRKLLYLLFVIFTICIISGCEKTNVEPNTMPSIIDEESLEQIIYKYSNTRNESFALEISSTKEDEQKNATGLQLRFNEVAKNFSEWKQYTALDVNFILNDINKDGQDELIIYLMEKTDDYEFVETLHILDTLTLNEIQIDEVNYVLNQYEKLNITSEWIRSGLLVNGRIYNLTKFFLTRVIPFSVENYATNTAIGIITLVENEGTCVVEIKDRLFVETTYIPKDDILTKSMEKWLNKIISPTIAIIIDNETWFFNWSIDSSYKYMVHDISINPEENYLLFYSKYELGGPEFLYVLDKSDMSLLTASWLQIINNEETVIDENDISVISISRLNDVLNPLFILLENDVVHYYNNWETDGTYFDLDFVDLNDDGSDEIILTLSVGSGTGVSKEKAHVISTNDFSELTYILPVDVIHANVRFSLTNKNERQKLLVYLPSEQIVEVTLLNNQFQTEDDLYYGHWESYNLIDNKLNATLLLSDKYNRSLGNFIISYMMDSNNLEVYDIVFIKNEE